MQESYKRNVLRTAGYIDKLKMRHIFSAVVKGEVLKVCWLFIL